MLPQETRAVGGTLLSQLRSAPGSGAKHLVESIARDVRFALRHFKRKPLTAVTVILVLSIGIGAHAAVFSLIQAATMRPAPGMPRDDALVAIRGKEKPRQGGRWRSRLFSYAEFRDFTNQRDVFASVVAFSRSDVTLNSGGDETSWANGQFVSASFFPAIGVRPALGPGLPVNDSPEANVSQLVAVIGYALWNDTFASSPEVIGKTIRVNDVAVRIVGVAPPGFNGAMRTGGTRTIWMPLSARAEVLRTTSYALASPDSAILQAVGRLRRGATVTGADATVRVIDAHAAERARTSDSVSYSADVVPLRGNLSVSPSNEITIMIAVYEALALLILLITCTNASALMIGSGVARRHEIATRLSLGASQARIVRQLLTESSVLAVTAGALGLLLYWWIANMLATQMPTEDISPDLATAMFTLSVALGTGLLFGLSPAIDATRGDITDALKSSASGATSRSRLQNTLIVAQIALTQPLLMGIGFTMAIILQDAEREKTNAIVASQTMQVGFDILGRIQLRPGSTENPLSSDFYKAQAARVSAAMERVAKLPGVVGVVRNSGRPEAMTLTTAPDDQNGLSLASQTIDVDAEVATAGYFGLLEIPIIRGRSLVASDTLEAEVPVVIGTDMAHDFLRGVDPLGVRLERKENFGRKLSHYVVVGIYDSRRAPARESRSLIYIPKSDAPLTSYLIRIAGAAGPVIAAVQSVIRSEIPQIPHSRLETLAEIDAAQRAEALRAGGTVGGGGVLALLLASIGLYGVVTLALTQRYREIGIRIALGAQPRQVVWMVFAGGMRLSLAGIVFGLPLSMAATNILASQTGLVEFNLLWIGAAIAIAVIGIASIATWVPARHAAGVQPTIALRAD